MADQRRRRYIGGVCALLAVVIIWVSSSFAMNSIFGEQNYNKPFLVTYLNTATFSLYLLPLLFIRKRKETISPEEYAKLLLQGTGDPTAEEEQEDTDDRGGDKLTTSQTIRLSLEFCFLWFLANYTTNASLAYTSVGSSTILSSTSGLFTLAIGALFRVENITWTRIAAVLVSFIGVVLVSYSDHEANDGNDATVDPSSSLSSAAGFIISAPLIGDMLALAGAFFYGCYTTLLKYRIGDESRINMPLFFGFVGAFNVVLLWPMFPILHWFGLEPFDVPHGSVLWATLLLNAFIGTFVSDYLWLLSMLMTSPLVVTLGISLTIPLALVGDVIFKHIIPGLQYAAGAILVLIGFFAVNMATLSEVEDKARYADRQMVPQTDAGDENQISEQV